MPNVYAILGVSNTRKSATVHALTGVWKRQFAWNVATTTGNIDVYVQIQALQEAKISAPDFVKIISDRAKRRKSPVSDILIPLRISAFNKCPDGAVYLQHFISVGWNIMPIVVLGVAVLPAGLPAGVRTLLIPGSASMAANGIASQIRPFWNWL